MKKFGHRQELLALAFKQFVDGNAGPSRDYLSDLRVCYAAAEQGISFAFAGSLLFGFELFLKVREHAVLELRRLGKVIGVLRLFDSGVRVLDLLAESAYSVDAVFFVFPFCLHRVEFFAQLG